MKACPKYFERPSLEEAAKRSQKPIPIIRTELKIDPNLLDYTKDKKYFIQTFGCQANERDGEFLTGLLELCGYQKAKLREEADIILLNTCAVRAGAEERIYGEIGHIKALKQVKPELILGVCGCMPQQEEVVEKLLKKPKTVDLIFGTHNLERLPDLIKEAYLSKVPIVEVYSKEGEVYENLPSVRSSNLKAWVNIMYGCDKFCTYCIVPYARGRERSRLLEDIIKEVETLKKQGYQEVTLLGQNVNAYGQDLKLGYNFEDLLVATAKTGIPRIRFMTSHPWNFTEGMLKAIRDYPNIMPAIHLPLQAGDNEILRKMGRRYSAEEYCKLYDRIRKEISNVAITTDIIVGFPNETYEQFSKTLDLVKYCKFDSAFTFIFSPRPGTPAAKMSDTVSLEEKKRRFKELIALVASHAKERNMAYLGKTLEVLVEGPSKRCEAILSGYSENNKLVNFKGDKSLIGQIVPVKITKAKSWTLEGEVAVDKEVKKAVDELKKAFDRDELIQEYRLLANKIAESSEIQTLEKELKDLQQKLCNYLDQNLKELYEETKEKYQELKKVYLENPLVNNYQVLKEQVDELLKEVSEILSKL